MQKNPYENVIAVTNRSLCQRPFAEQIERVCSLHPKAVILREKDLPEEEYSRLAEQILEICKRYQVPCILHTYVNVAEKLHHPYIHLPIFLLEKYEGKLGGFRQIGSSVHSVEDALNILRQDIFIQLTVKKDFHPEDWNFWRMSVKQ